MIDILKPLIQRFMPFAQEKMGFSRPPKLFLRQDEENASNPMGKTGFYDPQGEAITLYISGRHPKDIMRSLAHELQHHTQKCNGDFESVQNMGEEGYAQTNPHMRNMEIQAYQASIVFRDWEDSCKGTIYYEHLQKGDKSSMSTKNWKNRELNGLLMEKFGLKFNPLVESLDSRAITEDSEREEDEHEEDDRDADQKHIDAIRDHLRALEGDKDYDEDHIDEGCPGTSKKKKDDDSYGKWGKRDKEKRHTSLEEKHDRDWGDKGGDEGAESSGHGHDTDYAGHGMRKGDESDTHAGEDFEGDMGSDEDPKDLASELLALAHRMGNAVGVPSDVSTVDAEEEEETEEPMNEGRRMKQAVSKLHRAGFSKRQIKEFLTKAYSKALRS
jgi:hypothetical protein